MVILSIKIKSSPRGDNKNHEYSPFRVFLSKKQKRRRDAAGKGEGIRETREVGVAGKKKKEEAVAKAAVEAGGRQGSSGRVVLGRRLVCLFVWFSVQPSPPHTRK